MSIPFRAAAFLALSTTLAACAGRPQLRGGDGDLAACSARHCVSSTERSRFYYVEPLHYAGTQDAARARLVSALRGLPRTELVTVNPGYIYAQVTSPTLHFVDDVEFLFGAPGTIELRSSSRSGYYDFGVNRERVELIRRMFDGAS